MKKFTFSISVEVEESTGRLQAVYFRLRKGKSARTEELEDGNVFADYDARGRLLGIELLGPCRLSSLDRIVKDRPAQEFVHRSVPRELALA